MPTMNVRVMSAQQPVTSSARPEIDHDRQSARQRPAARVVAVAVPNRRDDHVGRARSPVIGTGGAQRRADVLCQQALPVHLEIAVACRLRTGEQLARSAHSRLGRALGGADPVELGDGLRAPPQIHRVVVDREHDPVGSQPVAEREREASRHDRLVDADLANGAGNRLALGLGERHPAGEQLLPAEVEEVEQLRIRERARRRGRARACSSARCAARRPRRTTVGR